MNIRARRALLVVLASVAVNWGALRPGFIHDDHRIIEQNGLTDGLGHLPEIARSGYWSTAEAKVPNLYRPLTILSFALDRTVHDLRPLGFRLFNLILHALNALLLLALAERLVPGPAGGAVDRPLFAALLFAIHPVHTEVLGEIVGRSELLAGACVLGSVLAFLAARRAPGGETPGRYYAWFLPGLALVLFVCGFLSKENAAVVPVLLLLADILVVRRRPAWGFHAAGFATLAALIALRHAVLGGWNPAGGVHFIDNPIAHLSFLQGRLTALAVLARYALLLVWPARLSIDYSFRAIPPATGLTDAGALLGAGLLVIGALHVAWSQRRSPGTAFALLFSAVTIAPVANLLFPIGTIMAERLLYLPSAGFCVATAAVVSWLLARRGAAGLRGVAAWWVVFLILAAPGARSIARLRDWRDDYTIFRAAVAVVPDSVRAQFNYAAACEERGDDDEAAIAYERALTIWPDFADAHYNLAGVLARRRLWPDAVEHYRRALRDQPGNVRYLVNLAHALVSSGRPAEAREALQRALEIDPRSALAYTGLGAAELALKNAEAALQAYEEAALLEPSNPDYLRNLGVARRESRDPRAALAFRAALAMRPGDPDLLDGLGLTLLDAQDATAAAGALREAVAARPDHPIYRYHLARALDQAGNLQEAATQYREAIRLAPGAPFPYKALGLLLARLGDGAGALAALERAHALDPKGEVMDEPARLVLRTLRRSAHPKTRTGS